MGGVVLATGPHFVEKERARLIGTAMQVVLKAPFLLASWRDQGAQLGFEEQLLPLLGAEYDNQSKRALGEFGDFGTAGTAATGALPGGFLRPSFGHVGGDCTPNRRNRKDKPEFICRR